MWYEGPMNCNVCSLRERTSASVTRVMAYRETSVKRSTLPIRCIIVMMSNIRTDEDTAQLQIRSIWRWRNCYQDRRYEPHRFLRF
ncbi:hypothetical protein L208DRAFT_277557 [Tricholoma matsutake]|nr:hypothetical protein L208DRAFT_277557 [Tricholoma matsutake 945]